MAQPVSDKRLPADLPDGRDLTQVPDKYRPLLDDLFAAIARYNPDPDRELITRAFVAACVLHGRQSRKSGEAYIHHPVGTALNAAELKLDSVTMAAALLHDVVEDTGTPLSWIEGQFGAEIAMLVDGVTKLTKMHFTSREEEQAENYRKMIVAMATDIRVILIKLCDRLHNMHTLCYLSKQKQIQKAKETLEVYAPLAHRLGIHNLKWQLEDLAFASLHPRKYQEIQTWVAQRRADREDYVDEAAGFLNTELDKAGIVADISGRAKHFYSIYTKMSRGGKEFNEIFDLTGLRVLVDSIKDCYGAVGIIHSVWKPIPGRFKDYIAMPKFNLYQSLHTTVIGPGGKPLEIQIRTFDMHQTAEFGVAALLIEPVRGDPEVGGLMHVVGADLDLEGLAAGADHRGVQRLVEVELRHRDVVFEAARDRFPHGVDDAHGAVAVLDGVDEDAQAGEVEDLVELLAAAAHLRVDGVEMLGAAADVGADAGLVELGAQKAGGFVDVVLAVGAPLGHPRLDLLVLARVQ